MAASLPSQQFVTEAGRPVGVETTLTPGTAYQMGVDWWKEKGDESELGWRSYCLLYRQLPSIKERVLGTPLEELVGRALDYGRPLVTLTGELPGKHEIFQACPPLVSLVLRAKRASTMAYLYQESDKVGKKFLEDWGEVGASFTQGWSNKHKKGVIHFHLVGVNGAWLALDQAPHHGYPPEEVVRLAARVMTEQAAIQDKKPN